MCNLYRMDRAGSEVAKLFGTIGAAPTANVPAEIYPGYPGLVVAGGELRSMVWGFPLAMKSKRTGALLKPRPVNNTRSDKLDSFMWRYSFAERRCLIPITEFAEAEGPAGAKTRSWFTLPDQAIFAAAGIWRETDEWGSAYSMVMTEADGVVATVHDRMPVLLHQDDWRRWTDGSVEEARGLCTPYRGAMAIRRTDELWTARRNAP
ncbi:DUF159 family protein [Altererythrobacter sp. B11]|uniref:SOS response-associated peptidase n=1 Tax=Altererythrobacter sp. B11 TaxID=2060312 RepID=UPI000DC70024|nr:SOS response-associated peptidase family protein [Altererythrobacter sp. B11]BBC72939.1 DUF159 family protein [Altererythrobacter sp. B11]